MNLVNIRVGDLVVSNKHEDVLSTSSLGSCIAIVMHDRSNSVGGIAHIQLPNSHICNKPQLYKPACFADLAIPLLLKSVLDLGAQKPSLKLHCVGGGSIFITPSHDLFHVGTLNILAVTEAIDALKLSIHAENLGGQQPRRVTLHINSGQINIHSFNECHELV